MTFDEWFSAYPTNEDYESNCRDAWDASAASRDAEVAELREQVTLLRDALLTLRGRALYLDFQLDTVAVDEALAATEPKEQGK